MDHPAHIAGAMRAQYDFARRSAGATEQTGNAVHRRDEPRSIRRREAREHRDGLLVRLAIVRREGSAPLACDNKTEAADIFTRTVSAALPAFRKVSQDATCIARMPPA